MTLHQTRILQAVHTLGGSATDRDVDKVLFSALKIGIVSGLAVFEYALAKRSRRYEKPLVYTNFIAAGVTGAVAARNYRVKPLPR